MNKRPVVTYFSNPTGKSWVLAAFLAEAAAKNIELVAHGLSEAAQETRVLIKALSPDLPEPVGHKFTPDEPWRRQGKRRGKRK